MGGASRRGDLTVHRLLLVGGGHAHAQVLAALARRPLPETEVTVVVDRPLALYSGMVPGLVAGRYALHELAIDVPALAQRAGARTRIGTAVHLDAPGRLLHLADGTEIPYDLISVNMGSTVAALDTPGVLQHAIPSRPISGLVERLLELATTWATKPREQTLRFYVVGGGAAGVELAFCVEARLARETGSPVRVAVLEGGGEILAGAPSRLRERVYDKAAARGIHLRTDCRVVEVGADSLSLDDGRRLESDAVLWVTGAVAHPLFRDSGLATDARGFLWTRDTLQARDYATLFAVGDCATLLDHPQTPKAGVYAVRQGPILTRNLRAALAGETLQTYSPQDEFLTLLNLGDGTAVGSKRGFAFAGRWVMVLKNAIDRRFVDRFPHPPG